MDKMADRIWKVGFKQIMRGGGPLPDGYETDRAWRMPPNVATLFASPEARRELTEMYRSLGGSLPAMPDFSRPEIQRLIVTRINQGLDRGELQALYRRAPAGTGSSGTPGSTGGGGAGPTPGGGGGAPPPSDPTPEKTWVDVQLVNEDGEPMAGERYILKITDGSVREGTLDASGRVRVNGIDPGTCTVIFPDLHASEWKRKS